MEADRALLTVNIGGQGGLYLFIDDSSRRRWIFMYTRGGKRTEPGLGGARDLSLDNARAEAAALRAVLARGGIEAEEGCRTQDRGGGRSWLGGNCRRGVGGLIAATLLTVPGALDFFVGGGVGYSLRARDVLFGLLREAYTGMRGVSEEYALL